MMLSRNVILSLGLLVAAACGGSRSGPACEDLNASCEWEASRSGDVFLAYADYSDCSWNYGVCIGRRHSDCKTWCENVPAVPSQCVYGCASESGTSTVTGGP